MGTAKSNGPFSVGKIVILRADPSVSGAVIQALPGEPEYRYVLFLKGHTATYYASQLQAQEEKGVDTAILSLKEFQARLSALQLSQPSLSNLYSLHAARVNFVPYQFRPVLKFVRADRPRLLIADEVGVGKTIEAGLILRELQARRDINSVLIICPKPLVTERKWQLEMKRFDEEFVHLDGPTLRHCIAETDLNGEWPDRHAKCIVPFSLFDEQLLYGGNNRNRKRRLGLLDLDPPPRFDLVIVDEAHHLRNTSTYLHQGVRFFLQNAEAGVFLTATPIQLQSDDLFVLLNLLRPDIIIDPQTFKHMGEPNPYIHEAINTARVAELDWQQKAHEALSQAGSTAWGRVVLQGNTDYQQVCHLLKSGSLSPQERLAFIRDTENLYTFANLINRTRRRDIGNFTTRKPETVAVEFTESQRQLHDALLAAQARILQRTHGVRTVKFLMSTLRRQAASCLYGLAPLIERILQRRMAELEWGEIDEDYEEIEGVNYVTLQEEIQQVLDMARNLNRDDPKLEALLRILHEKQVFPNNKALLFSSFRHTLRYLELHLQQAGLRIGLIHGDIPEEERVTLRNRFSGSKDDPHTIDVLLSSEVGCEGLDYQFCDCLINYDLPWNPSRIEQRLGRIDRYGQPSETVAIYNIVTPGTVDFDIYDRCHLRIGFFRQALGGNEEILGRITRELRSVAESLELTQEERQERLQQIADNHVRFVQEQARLEEDQVQFFGILLPPQQLEQDIRDASSAWLTPSALQNLVQSYLSATRGGEAHILGDRPLKTLRLSQEARNRLLDDFRNLSRQASPLYRDWEKWLKGSESRLEITFDAVCAAENREVMFITPVHPLIQQAACMQQQMPPFRTTFRVKDVSLPPGQYPFAIYQWQRTGVREDAVLQPVCAMPIDDEQFLNLLDKAETIKVSEDFFSDFSVFADLESAHYKIWAKVRAEHQELTRQIGQYRRESLRVSHQSRVALLREQYQQTSNDKIRRMRDAQISNAEADYHRRMQEVETAERRADIISKVVAFGVMIVEGRKRSE